jgi:hypothetical protein
MKRLAVSFIFLLCACSIFDSEPTLKVGVYARPGDIITVVDFWAKPDPPAEVEWTLLSNTGLDEHGVDAVKKDGLWLHRVLVIAGYDTELCFTASTGFAEKSVQWKEAQSE